MINIAKRCAELMKIHSELKKEFELPLTLNLIFRPDYDNGIAKRFSDGTRRIYIPGWTLQRKEFEVSLHYLLHELAHHIVGIKHQHDSIFEKQERELLQRYGYTLSSYVVPDETGKPAYAMYLYPINDFEKKIYLFKT
jgi:hypothetical protein